MAGTAGRGADEADRALQVRGGVVRIGGPKQHDDPRAGGRQYVARPAVGRQRDAAALAEDEAAEEVV